MAKKKSSRTKQRGSPTSPNTVLVLFLVFFVLLSIGLGVWGYYGYAGQKDLKDAAANAEKAKNAAFKAEAFANLINREVRVAALGRGSLLKEEGSYDENSAQNAERNESNKHVQGRKYLQKKLKKQQQYVRLEPAIVHGGFNKDLLQY